ncbi:helix-turn-helix domain-containing protein [Microbispora bryophytorum]|uniref:Helix-turn-helix transcriptional regulator n=1 Tax=Microbispora bryophytorum subsp. camponoti TaxID=1677852 RepID=A0ABR8LCL3_9ACTN|nr:helix-turn-helix transcriptional regulator [Microbispora camponoti]MBD3146476.1 helix-turn-helix transcriptional regulator [Microbispora camponoti]
MAVSGRSVVVDIRTRRAGKERDPAIPDGPDLLLRTVYGEILRDERLDQDRTLDDVARAVGMSKQYLSEVERGRKEPSSEMLHSVCDALGLPIEHLLTRAVRRITASRRIATRGSAGTPRVQLLAA